MTNNEKIARWLKWDFKNPRVFDEDISLWHGITGVFAEIEEKGHNRAAMFVFYLRDVLKMEKGETNFWKYMTATPSQLTAALVKMIEEEEDENTHTGDRD